MSKSDIPLWQRIRMRADADELPADHELRQLAEKFETATAEFYAVQQTVTVKQFMGHYARARRAWCAYTGEPLI